MTANVTITATTPETNVNHRHVATCTCGWTGSARTHKRVSGYAENHAAKHLRG